MRTFERLLEELRDAIRSGNGTPFPSRAVSGLSELSGGRKQPIFENRSPFSRIRRRMENTPVVASLQREQASALVLFLNYKKYHWLTCGPHFRDYHLLFEEHAGQVLASIDELAERALMVDGRPLADASRYLPASFVPPSEGERTPRQMIDEAIAAHDKVIEQMHGDAGIATRAGDIGTADLFTRLVQVHQKARWFLREIARKEP